MALALEARLLCAATQAYAVRVAGLAPSTLPPPNPTRSELVGWTQAPYGFATGADLIDAALVGITADATIVAFRGTLPPGGPDVGQTILDWASDADAPFVRGTDLPGLVHQGFLSALDSLWPLIDPVVVNAANVDATKPILVTGHSKGGAAAYLAAMRLKAILPGIPIIVRTFAAARAGDVTFVTAYNAAIPNSWRYEYADDIVPHLPPADALLTELGKLPIIGSALGNLHAGYKSAGQLQYIPRGAAPGAPPQSDSPALDNERIQSLLDRLRAFDFNTIKSDHSIDFGSGYANAVGSV